MSDRKRLLEAIHSSDKFLLTTHENPDGDALGSLVGMNAVLTELGKDSIMFMRESEFPLPYEYRDLLGEDQAVHFAPNDLDERTVIFLDCGNIDRMKVDFITASTGLTILNIDHHHDNTRFGSVNLVAPELSCTAEIIYALTKDLGVEMTDPIAQALYVGLVTDTGMFMYENTGAYSHMMAAELIEFGVNVHAIYSRLYENQPYGKVQLLARGLSRTERYDGGLLTITHLLREDFEQTNSEETFSEGIVDHMRAVAGTAVGGLVRELTGDRKEHQRKISLRSTDGRVDVSMIARGFGGGGHRRAAGATTQMSYEDAIEFIREGIRAQLSTAA